MSNSNVKITTLVANHTDAAHVVVTEASGNTAPAFHAQVVPVPDLRGTKPHSPGFATGSSEEEAAEAARKSMFWHALTLAVAVTMQPGEESVVTPCDRGPLLLFATREVETKHRSINTPNYWEAFIPVVAVMEGDPVLAMRLFGLGMTEADAVSNSILQMERMGNAMIQHASELRRLNGGGE